VEDDRVLSELVEVGYRFYENGGGCGHACEFARANGLEDREERVRILADGDQLAAMLATNSQFYMRQLRAYLCPSLCNNAGCVVLLQ
jgi:hypothetical protein